MLLLLLALFERTSVPSLAFWLRVPMKGLSDLAWTENNGKIATASDDKLIKIFDVETVSLFSPQKLTQLGCSFCAVRFLVFRPGITWL